jgi:cell division protein FtsB
MAIMHDHAPERERPLLAPKTRVRQRLRSAQEIRDRRRRLVTYGLLFGSFVLMVNALVGEHGYLATLRAQREYNTLAAAIARVEAQNQEYLDQARRLKSDPSALEQQARQELGLIKPGETLVIIRDAKPAPPAPASTPK